MESGEISDAQISASSHWDNNHAARQGRLHFKEQGGKAGSWSSRTNDLNQWLQVDIGSYTTVTGIATQGRNSIRYPQWVTKFKLQYSVDGVIFQFYKEPGNNSAKVCLKNPKMSPFGWKISWVYIFGRDTCRKIVMCIYEHQSQFYLRELSPRTVYQNLAKFSEITTQNFKQTTFTERFVD